MAVQAQMYPRNLGEQLCGSQDLYGLMNSDDFVCNLKHPQQLQQVQHWQQNQHQQQQQCLLLPQQLETQQQRNQGSAFDNNFVFSAMKSEPTTTNTTIHQSNSIAMGLSQSWATLVERQRQEIDRCINLQSQKLKLALQEQRKQELATLFRKLEAKAGILLRQKDEEIAQARKKTMELEGFMKRMEMENQSWKRITGENEAMIANLNTSLQQLREKAATSFQQQQQQEDPSNGAMEDAESCCHVNNGGEEEEEEEDKMSMACRACRCRNSSVLFLPCRHLCCCTSCEAFLDACPVCKSPKRGTIEALIS